MKRFFRPRGPAFWIGIILMALCLLSLIATFYASSWYNALPYEKKDAIEFFRTMFFGLALMLIIGSLPTAPSDTYGSGGGFF